MDDKIRNRHIRVGEDYALAVDRGSEVRCQVDFRQMGEGCRQPALISELREVGFPKRLWVLRPRVGHPTEQS